MSKDKIELTIPVSEPTKRYWKFEIDPKLDGDAPDKKRPIVGSVLPMKEVYPGFKDAVALKLTIEPVFKTK